MNGRRPCAHAAEYQSQKKQMGFIERGNTNGAAPHNIPETKAPAAARSLQRGSKSGPTSRRRCAYHNTARMQDKPTTKPIQTRMVTMGTTGAEDESEQDTVQDRDRQRKRQVQIRGANLLRIHGVA